MSGLAGVLRRSVYRLHFVVASLAGGLAFVGLSIVGLFYAFLFRSQARRAPFLFAQAFSGLMRAALGWRIEAEGLELLSTIRPALIVANHQSNLDVVIFGSIFPTGTVAVGKKELERIPMFGWFFTATGNILLDRQNRQDALRAIREAAGRIRAEGVSVWMFPEGHRNQKPELLPFKKGAFHLAIAAQVPVLIAVSEPLDAVMDPRRLLVRSGSIRIRVLPPIPSAGRTAEDVDALLAEVRGAMQKTRDELAATANERID